MHHPVHSFAMGSGPRAGMPQKDLVWLVCPCFVTKFKENLNHLSSGKGQGVPQSVL